MPNEAVCPTEHSGRGRSECPIGIDIQKRNIIFANLRGSGWAGGSVSFALSVRILPLFLCMSINQLIGFQVEKQIFPHF